MSTTAQPDYAAIGQSIAKHILLLQKEGLVQDNKTDYSDIKGILDVLTKEKSSASEGGSGAAAQGEGPLLDNYRRVSDYFNLGDKPTMTYALQKAISGLPVLDNANSHMNLEKLVAEYLKELEKSGKGP
ncbi:uncharacterized protein I303_103136 [Kwoniella dejecticola CBS 10117]|uniref:Uncharacterized protein n=1 Tax=Kwoniella dejecticola CBS 10117 TaxID=1296121 RepID=A0A1A6AAN8_9TREE|nr:uncharacterized protein I303_03156 [Kwoniella dejecticola CBS 10117]OBR87132.1 hypothetical protein I303_03156 [Kwoniella dejecticola CBS 10117]